MFMSLCVAMYVLSFTQSFKLNCPPHYSFRLALAVLSCLVNTGGASVFSRLKLPWLLQKCFSMLIYWLCDSDPHVDTQIHMIF